MLCADISLWSNLICLARPERKKRLIRVLRWLCLSCDISVGLSRNTNWNIICDFPSDRVQLGYKSRSYISEWLSWYHTFLSRVFLIREMPAENSKQYPDAADIVEEGELTLEELKEAFRFSSRTQFLSLTLIADCLTISAKASYPWRDSEKYW